jgi:hypothetical protein
MTRQMGWLLSLLILAVPASAISSGSISGVVKSSDGTPQMGAAVEIFSAGSLQSLILYTDDAGRYSASNVNPGVYNVKVSAASFLPTLRENVSLRSGAHVVINLTLNTLFEAMQLLPPRKNSPQDDDDWKWTLRSAANRPILRVLDNEPLVLVSQSERKEDRALKARVAFVAGSGSDGFGESTDYATAFNVDQSVFSDDTLSFSGKVGYGNGPAGVFRTSFSHQFANGSDPKFAVTLRRTAPAGNSQGATLSSLEWTYSDTQTIADFLELKYGGQMQTVQFMGRISGFRPYGSMGMHLSRTTKLEYAYATAEPIHGFDRGLAGSDLADAAPRISVVGNSMPVLEKAKHQEIALSQKIGKTNLQAAFFSDHMRNMALIGAGSSSDQDLDFLPDYSADTFTYNGGNLHSNGMRLVVERRLTNDVIAAFDYALGNALVTQPGTAGENWQQVRSTLHPVQSHTLTAKFSGRVPLLQTRWGASYKWCDHNAVSQVDLFNSSVGHADPFLNFFVRQPIPSTSFLPGKLEAMVDVRNLLEQGYRPFMGQDGRTLYLVQSARAIRGGLAFTF